MTYDMRDAEAHVDAVLQEVLDTVASDLLFAGIHEKSSRLGRNMRWDEDRSVFRDWVFPARKGRTPMSWLNWLVGLRKIKLVPLTEDRGVCYGYDNRIYVLETWSCDSHTLTGYGEVILTHASASWLRWLDSVLLDNLRARF